MDRYLFRDLFFDCNISPPWKVFYVEAEKTAKKIGGENETY